MIILSNPGQGRILSGPELKINRQKLVLECRLTGCRTKDEHLVASAHGSCVECAGARLPKSGDLGPPSSSPSHVIFQRDLEYSLS